MRITEPELLINRLPRVINYSDESIRRLLKLLPLLPASDSGIFEFRIFPLKNSIDYSQPIRISHMEKLETLRTCLHIEPPHDKDSVTWENFGKCIRQLNDKNGCLHDRVETIWIEYDNENMETLLPSFFLSFRKRVGTDLKFETCKKLLPLFNNGHSFENDLPLVENTVKKMNPDVSFFQFGIMLPRRSNEMKLVVGPWSVADVNDVMDMLPQGDDYILPERFLSRFHDHTCNISLSISNGRLVGIGIELICFNSKKGNALKEAIENFIISENITEAFFIRPFLYVDKSIVVPSQTEEDWPDALIFKSLYSENFTFPKLEFYFNHIKVCFRNKVLASLKAYLYYRFSCRR